MKNTTSNKKLDPINLSDIREAIEKVDDLGSYNPIQEIKMGKNVLKKVKQELLKSTGKKGKFEGLIGSLFGVKVVLDKSLKPNQYKVIRWKEVKPFYHFDIDEILKKHGLRQPHLEVS